MGRENKTEKSTGPSKSFMTVGPTLHYSHSNVQRCWLLAVGVYVVTCVFWSKITTGTIIAEDLQSIFSMQFWSLGQFITNPLDIYEYPWQIVVLGLVMGILAAAPVIMSQLLCFRYSIPMLLCLIFLAKLPLLGLVMFISCVAVACRPLRFRSRFIAIALCMAPQIAYWAAFGGIDAADPLKWGLSFAPWTGAWLTGLFIAAAVIGIGHFTRYRPGLVWIVTGLVLTTAMVLFQSKVGFVELDYQLYIAKNNPEEISEFHDHNVTAAIDATLTDSETRKYLSERFYSTDDMIMLRQELKAKIAEGLSYDRWPKWFKVPDELRYQQKRDWLLVQYETFIKKWSTSQRKPIALYCKALLKEYSPDIQMFEQAEVLHFYNDYPRGETLRIWYELFEDFPQSPESLEARWRIAMHHAASGDFDTARELCQVTDVMLDKQIRELQKNALQGNSMLSAFSNPSKTIMTPFKLQDIQFRVRQLELLISDQNLSDDQASRERLTDFVILDNHSRDYVARLDDLLAKTKEDDPLRDNMLLARIMLISDGQLRAAQLEELCKKTPNSDGGIRALYELGLLNVKQWKDIDEDSDHKKEFLTNARTILARFISEFPDSIYEQEASRMLSSLPTVE